VKGVLRREPAVDFRTAKAAELEGLPDGDVLAIAASEGRILVTHDRSTMPWAFARFVETTESPGVLIISQSAMVADAIEDLLLIWLASEDADWTNLIAKVPL
jgi:predicted nuclease of predicted toxin-antitoxin system